MVVQNNPGVAALPGGRVLIGTVQEVRGAQARIDTGDRPPSSRVW